jgi:hypothetical protein
LSVDSGGSDHKGPKSMRKNALPTGAAQPVTNTLERVRAIFKDRPEPAAPPEKERSDFRKSKAEIEGAEEPSASSDADEE